MRLPSGENECCSCRTPSGDSATAVGSDASPAPPEQEAKATVAIATAHDDIGLLMV
jgi:hypothetical protein